MGPAAIVPLIPIFFRRATLLFSFLLIAVSLAIAADVPPLQGRVNDYGKLLSAATRAELELSIQALEETDSTQIAVLTVPSLEGDILEEFSFRVAEKWQIGRAGRDNGVLLLVAVKERKIRIEVGYGLEGVLTDLKAGRIIRNTILPRFQEGNFNQGVVDGVNAISMTIKGEYAAGQDSATGYHLSDPAGIIGMLAFFFFFVGSIFSRKPIAAAAACGIGAPVIGTMAMGFSLPLVLFLIPVGIAAGFIMAKTATLSANRSRSSAWGGRGGGGSFGGFSGSGGGFSGGGGGFGGGGASGSW